MLGSIPGLSLGYHFTRVRFSIPVHPLNADLLTVICFANIVGCVCSAQRGITSLASNSKRQGEIIDQRLNKKNDFSPSSIMTTNGEENALREQ